MSVTLARPPLGNGLGRWWLRCAGPCFADSPEWVRPDALRLLALCQAVGWRVTGGPDGVRVWCPRCQRRGVPA